MKNIKLNILTITFLAIFFTFSTAGAGERVKVFEMGESGVTIEFPMTPEEIAAEDAASVKVIAASKKGPIGASKNVIVFEMGESGHKVAFPMTADEIAVLKAENERQAAIETTRAAAPPDPVVKFELAESGHFIEFSELVQETELGDLVIARDTADNGAAGVPSLID